MEGADREMSKWFTKQRTNRPAEKAGIRLPRISYQKRKALFSFLMVLPWIVGFLVFSFKPIMDIFVYSFHRTRSLASGEIQLEWVELENFYTVLFTHVDFFEGVQTYLYEILLKLPVVVVFSLLIALLLNHALPGRRFFRVLFFLPVVLMQGPLLDVVNDLDALKIAGVDSMFVFSYIKGNLPPEISGPLMYIINEFIPIIWYSGVQILLCLAGLQKLDASMYEAASIDGASAWQVLWKITLPVSKPFILLSGVYTVVDLSNLDSNPIITLIKDRMFTEASGFGYSSAVALMYFFLMLLIAGLVFLVLGRSGERKVKKA